MSNQEDSKKEQQRKKNRKNWELFLNFAGLNKNVDIAAPVTETKLEPIKAPKNKMDPECSEKLATVYKSIELRKREANDRWNRFAGTEGGGGRGR